MAKFCSNCGKKLNENADICLKCGVFIKENEENKKVDNKKKNGLPAWAVVLIILGCLVIFPIIILIVLFSIFVSITDSKVPSEFKEFENYMEDFERVEDDIKKYTEKYDSNITEEGELSDTLEVDGIKFTLNKFDNYSYTDNESGEEKNYLVFFLDVENTSDEDRLISSFNFKGALDGEEIVPKFLFEKFDDISLLNANVKSGEKVSGYVAFEVEDDWESFELRYKRIITNNSIVFRVYNATSEEKEESV